MANEEKITGVPKLEGGSIPKEPYALLIPHFRLKRTLEDD